MIKPRNTITFNTSFTIIEHHSFRANTDDYWLAPINIIGGEKRKKKRNLWQYHSFDPLFGHGENSGFFMSVFNVSERLNKIQVMVLNISDYIPSYPSWNKKLWSKESEGKCNHHCKPSWTYEPNPIEGFIQSSYKMWRITWTFQISP